MSFKKLYLSNLAFDISFLHSPRRVCGVVKNSGEIDLDFHTSLNHPFIRKNKGDIDNQLLCRNQSFVRFFQTMNTTACTVWN